MIINDMPSGGLSAAGSSTQPVYINSNGDAVATTYALDMVSTSQPGLMSAADKTKLNGVAEGATANVGTITGVTMNGSSKGTSGVVDLGTVLTSHQSIKTLNGNSMVGSGNISIPALPSVSSSDNGKILKVVNGAWAKGAATEYAISYSGTWSESNGVVYMVYASTTYSGSGAFACELGTGIQLYGRNNGTIMSKYFYVYKNEAQVASVQVAKGGATALLYTYYPVQNTTITAEGGSTLTIVTS